MMAVVSVECIHLAMVAITCLVAMMYTLFLQLFVWSFSFDCAPLYLCYSVEIFRLLVALIHQPIPAVAWVVVVIWAVVILDLITKVRHMLKACVI